MLMLIKYEPEGNEYMNMNMMKGLLVLFTGLMLLNYAMIEIEDDDEDIDGLEIAVEAEAELC